MQLALLATYVVVVVLYFLSCIGIVKQYQRGVVFRLGPLPLDLMRLLMQREPESNGKPRQPESIAAR